MIYPIKDYILLEEMKEENKSGIVIPDEVDRKLPNKAKIVSMGEERSIPCKTGEIVLFKRYLFEEIEEDGKKFLIGKE